MTSGKVIITEIGDVLVFRKIPPESRIFLNTEDTFIISKALFISLLNGLIQKGSLSPKVLEGILEEFNTE